MTEKELAEAQTKPERIADHMETIRGAQFDILNGRPEMDALEEISAALSMVDEELA